MVIKESLPEAVVDAVRDRMIVAKDSVEFNKKELEQAVAHVRLLERNLSLATTAYEQCREFLRGAK